MHYSLEEKKDFQLYSEKNTAFLIKNRLDLSFLFHKFFYSLLKYNINLKSLVSNKIETRIFIYMKSLTKKRKFLSFFFRDEEKIGNGY